MRMRSRCGTRMHVSSKFSSLLSTVAQEHASAAVHRCEPAASGPGQQVAACSGCAGTASRPVNQRGDPLLGKIAREGVPNRRRAVRLWAPRPAAAGCATPHVEPHGIQDPSSQRPSRASSSLLREPARERHSAGSDAAQQVSHAARPVRRAPPFHVCMQRSSSGIARSTSRACSRSSTAGLSAPASPPRSALYALNAHSKR
jgi:hypothetical protein